MGEENILVKKGISIGTVVLIIVPIAIIFGGGVYVYMNDKATKDKNDLNSQISQLESQVSALRTTVTPGPAGTVSATISTTASSTSAELTKDQALAKVKDLPEVKTYLAKNSKNVAEFDHEDAPTNSWVIHVFYNGPDLTATFNWYSVNKVTGDITKTF